MIDLWHGGGALYLPWLWLTFRMDRDGGFSIELERPRGTRPPDLIGYLEFYPHWIRLLHWRCPQSFSEWKRQFRWWWMDLRGEW
jgi:hypothetical protein